MLIDGVRVLYASSRKEFCSENNNCYVVVNPEAGENEPQVYVLNEAMPAPDEALASMKADEGGIASLAEVGRRIAYPVPWLTAKQMTINDVNATIKCMLPHVSRMLDSWYWSEKDGKAYYKDNFALFDSDIIYANRLFYTDLKLPENLSKISCKPIDDKE